MGWCQGERTDVNSAPSVSRATGRTARTPVRKARLHCSHFKEQATESREEPIPLPLGSHSTNGKVAGT